ncbi:glycosyltransferase family 2 protein [Pseudoruegeria sp. SHC-113]|uniref:glycosyltransferase family 2 protein n=1 Tax=Pseudoruegeria sp. SHC-113 TaxID=2855439 RepID=UPI0021BAE2D4|nr:glycosyltransferase family 2 protein [Pseudoruegeria sp. SHC-113]MCT8160089.1 glycosyltransferase [Pseudoruegeria sp. SHC-113]
MTTFSIILPCYNAQTTIAATLDSLIAQSFTDWEAICVDDGSSDATLAILKAYAARDPRISLVDEGRNGPSGARNLGAARATGRYLAFCDADDLWTDTKLADLAEAFAATGSDALYSQIAFFTREGEPSTTSTVPQGALTIAQLLGENPVCTLSNLTVLRDVFALTGGFATDMAQNEDLEWLIRAVGEGCVIRGLPQLHVWYRASQGGLSADLEKMAASRQIALATAARYGVQTTPEAEAVYLRYLARRALRLDMCGTKAARLTAAGLRASPRAFLSPLRRGGLTALAAAAAPALPRSLRQSLFAQ